MKIEKISDTQVKFILNKTDLNERNIKITELAYGSEKTQELFREMMDQAMKECGFNVDNVPLMIEAIPVAIDSIMIIVTKVKNSEDIENKFNFLQKSKEHNIFKKKEFLESIETIKNSDTLKETESNSIYIYSFASIDDAKGLSERVNELYTGESALYKNEGRFYLVLENCRTDKAGISLDLMAGEYGSKHVAGLISKYYLVEHGEVLIKKQAVNILANI